MSFTTTKITGDRNKSAYHEVSHANEDVPEKADDLDHGGVNQSTSLKGRGGTAIILSMAAPYILGICIAATHFALNTHLHGKRIDIDTSLPQSWASAISLILVNTFRLTLCFCLGVAFTQILWHKVGVKTMRLGDLDRLQHLQTDLRALLLQPTIHRVVPILSIIAVLGWLITVAMVLPPGSLTVVNKDFVFEVEQKVPGFNATFLGNGTWASTEEYLLGGLCRMAIHVYKTRSLGYSKSNPNDKRNPPFNIAMCVQFYGPAVKCNNTVVNETVFIHKPWPEHFRPPIYSGGWSSMNGSAANDSVAKMSQSMVAGWQFPDHDAVSMLNARPGTFFVAQYKSPPQLFVNVTEQVKSYARITDLTTCRLYRGIYELNTEYLNGQRRLTISINTRESLDTLWDVDGISTERRGPLGPLEATTSPIKVEVTNLFALADALVQPLIGEYYNHTVLGSYSKGYVTLDPRLGFQRTNQTIIADTGFNLASYKYEPVASSDYKPDDFKLDLSEAKINEALQNITLSVMYTLNWWPTLTNTTQTRTYNIFSFSSRPRLIVPYAASLILSLPFLYMGIRALRLNGMAFEEPGFVQTLVATAGSEGLREVITNEGAGREEDVMGARIRYGYTYGEEEGRKTIGLEDEIVGAETKARE